MTRGGRGREAELYVIQRINELPGWSAVDANDLRSNQPGYDALATHERGRQLRVSTKSIETKKKGYFEVGGVKPLVDVYALVDMTQPYPWPIYLAGAKPVQSVHGHRFAPALHTRQILGHQLIDEGQVAGAQIQERRRLHLEQQVVGVAMAPEELFDLLRRKSHSRRSLSFASPSVKPCHV